MGLIAIREDEDKAATIGINTPVYKILGFVASAVFLGMAGGVYGYYIAFIDPAGMFNIVLSVQIILAVLLGGRATLWGPVLGASIVEPLNEIANHEFGGGNSRLLIFGGLLALMMLLLPKGIIPSVETWLETRAPAGKAGAGRRPPRPAHRAARARGAAGAGPPPTGRRCSRSRAWRSASAACARSTAARSPSPEGSITGLIGPNGSGKTTVFNLIGGTMRPTPARSGSTASGSSRLRPWRRAHAGLGRTFQITRVFADMTVLENVVAPLRASPGGQLRPERSAATRPTGPRSCSSSSAWASTATSPPRRSRSASGSWSSSPRC